MPIRFALATVLLFSTSAAFAETPRSTDRTPCPMQTHHIPAGKTVTSPIVTCTKATHAVAVNDRRVAAPERPQVARD